MISSGFKFFEIKRLNSESFQDYLERYYFIVNNLRSGKYSYEELLEKSLIFSSIKVLKCGYQDSTMKEIDEMSIYAGLSSDLS